jgi:hypothetical protein
MAPEIIPDDSDYASEEDSDFAPDAVPAVASDASSDEESEAEDIVKVTPKASAKRKRGDVEEAEDAGFENSGDEAIIERGLKRRKKGKGKDAEEEEEGGEGGVVRTRSMRALECVFRYNSMDLTNALIGRRRRRNRWQIRLRQRSTSTRYGRA